MRQRIKHNAEIETATPGEIEELLARQHHHRLMHIEKGVINLNAGVGTQAIKLSREFDWRMKRVTIGGPGAVNALVLISESDSGSDADMLEFIQPGAAGRYSDAFSNDIWVPAGNRIVIAVSNGAPGQVTYNIQAQLEAVV